LVVSLFITTSSFACAEWSVRFITFRDIEDTNFMSQSNHLFDTFTACITFKTTIAIVVMSAALSQGHRFDSTSL
jgi:hypothetical protein